MPRRRVPPTAPGTDLAPRQGWASRGASVSAPPVPPATGNAPAPGQARREPRRRGLRPGAANPARTVTWRAPGIEGRRGRKRPPDGEEHMMAVIEMFVFSLVPGTDEAAFLEADQRVQTEFSYQQPGLVRRTTARADHGDVRVLVLWASGGDGPAPLDRRR